MPGVKHPVVLDLAEGRRRAIWNAALLVGLGVAGLALLHLTRDTTFFVDEWVFVQDRRGWDAGTYLEPHNEHLALVPVAVYKLLFETAGLDNYLPYRLLVTATHLLCVTLLYVYARRRVDAPWAALLALLLLVFGPGWQNILWPFQFAWGLSIACGIGALFVLDRGQRGAVVAVCLLLSVALASSPVGIAIFAGVALEVLLTRRREAWMLLLPLGAYVAWWLAYGDSGGFIEENVFYTPAFVVNVSAATLGSLVGLAGNPIPDAPGTMLDWGRPLLVVAAGAAAWRLSRMGSPTPRLLALLVMALGFLALTGLGRATFAPPHTSRYVYVAAVVALLIAAELCRGVGPRRRVTLGAATVLAVIATIANVGVMRDAGGYLRGEAETARASLAAIELAQASLPPGYRALVRRPTALLDFRAARYLTAAADDGSPAPDPADLPSFSERARRVADNELVAIHNIVPRPLLGRPPLGAAPAVERSSGDLVRRDGCLTVRAPEVAPAGVLAGMDLVAPRGGGVLVRAAGGPATLSVRRFADRFLPRGTADGAPGVISTPADASHRPWRVRIETAARATACGLADMP